MSRKVLYYIKNLSARFRKARWQTCVSLKLLCSRNVTKVWLPERTGTEQGSCWFADTNVYNPEFIHWVICGAQIKKINQLVPNVQDHWGNSYAAFRRFEGSKTSNGLTLFWCKFLKQRNQKDEMFLFLLVLPCMCLFYCCRVSKTWGLGAAFRRCSQGYQPPITGA